MPSPYLSRIKLEKELEKRARAIKEKRGRSEKLLKSVDEGLELLKNYIDVSKYREEYTKAKKSFEIKDFDKTLSILEPLFNALTQEAQKIFENEEKKISNLLASGKIEDSARIKANMDEAKAKLSSNFVESLKIMENVNSTLLTSLKEVIEKRKLEMLTKISTLEFLQDIKEKIESFKGSSLSIIDSLDGIEKEIKRRVRNEVDKKIKEADELIGIAKSAHYTLPVDEERKKDAYSLLESGDFINALKNADEYLSASRDAFKLFFTKLMDISRILIKEGEIMGENMEKPREFLQKAEKLYGEDKLEEAVNLIRKATEEAEKIKLHKVLDIIKVARDKLLEAKSKGIDIAPYLLMIENARNFMKIGKHKRAYDTVVDAINQVERKMNLHTQLKNEIAELKSTLEELRKENIILEGVDEKLSEIEAKVEEDPEEAERMIDDFKKLIKLNLRDIATSLHQDLTSLIAKGEEASIDLRSVEVELDNIEKILEGENYKESIIGLRKIEEELYSIIFDRIKERLKEFEKYDDEKVKEKIGKVQAAIDSGEIEETIESFKELENYVFGIESKKYEELLKDMENQVSFLQNLGEDTSTIEEYIKNARDAMQKRELDVADKYIKEGRTLVDTLSKSIAERAYDAAKEAADKASKIKIDLEKNGIIELLNKAAESLKNKNYADVLKHTAEIKSRIEELKAALVKVKELRERLEKRISTIKEQNLPSKELENMLEEVDKRIDENEFKAAEELIIQALDRAKLIEMEGKLNALKNEIEALGAIMKKFKFREDYLTITQDFFVKYREKKYEGLEELGKEVIEKLKKSLESVFSNYLNRLESMVEELQDLGAKIDSSPLREGKEQFWAGKIIDAFKTLEYFEDNIKKLHGEKMKLKDIEEHLGVLLTLATSLGINTDTYVSRAKEVEKIEDSGEKMKKLQSLIGEMEKELNEKIEAIIQDVDSELDKMRRMGEDVTAAEGMINRARAAMKERKYKEAFNFTLNAMEEIENLEMQKNTAYGMLKIVEKKITKMKGLLPKEIIEEYKKARSAFLKERYKETIKRAINVSDRLWNIERIIDTIKEKNAEIKIFIQQAKRMGIDMKNVLVALANAKKELQNLQYERALKYVNQAHKEARRAIESVKSAYRAKYEPLVKMIIEFDLREDFLEQMEEIENAFNNNEVSKLEALISALKEGIEKKIRENLDMLMAKFEDIAKFVDSSPLKAKFDFASERKKLESLKSSPAEFVEYHSKLMERLTAVAKDAVRTHIGKFVERLKEFESFGVNVSDYIERASNLESRVEDMDYKEAMKELKALENNFEVYIEEYFREKIKHTVDLVSKYTKKRAEEYRKRMEDALKNRDYITLVKIADEAMGYVGDYRTKVGTFNKKALDLKELIKHAISLGLNMDEHIKSLKGILSSPESLDEAIKSMDKLSEEIKRLIDGLKPKLRVSIMDVQKSGDKYLAKLQIKNEGNTEAKNVSITLEGALTTENPIAVTKIGKSSEELLEVLVNEGEGEKIIGKIKYQRFDDKSFEEEFSLEYRVAKKGFHVEKNKEKVKCTLCRGTILPGLDIVVCDNCGAVYHLPCAKRAGKCLKCGTPFKFE